MVSFPTPHGLSWFYRIQANPFYLLIRANAHFFWMPVIPCFPDQLVVGNSVVHRQHPVDFIEEWLGRAWPRLLG